MGGWSKKGEQLEEQFSSCQVKGNIPQFIQDQEIHSFQLPEKIRQPPLLFRFNQLVDKSRRRLEHHPIPLFTGQDPRGDRKMGLPGSRVPDHQDILMLFDEL